MILELENVCKKRSENYALRVNRLGMEAGEHVAILGPSGCGKSTTLDMIGMVLDPDLAGKFMFSPAGEKFDIAGIWKERRDSRLAELRRKHVGYILQTGEIFAFLNVRANIELTALAAGVDRETASRRADELMDRLELGSYAKASPATLSIGQRQRTAIARALAPNPALLLADEPTSALDPGLARKVMKLMLEAVKDYGTTLIMVSHDHQLVSEFDFRIAHINMHDNEARLDE